MQRWVLLVFLNSIAQAFVLYVRIRFFDPDPNLILPAIQFSLALPLSPVLYFAFPFLPLPEFLALVATTPLLWATMVEWGLRRFVDPPKASPDE